MVLPPSLGSVTERNSAFSKVLSTSAKLSRLRKAQNWTVRGLLKIEVSPKLGRPTKPKVGLSANERNFAPIERIPQNWGVLNAPKVGGIATESIYAFNEYRVVPVGGVLKVEGSQNYN